MKKLFRSINDLGTKYPEVAKEWHPTKNGELTPFDVSFGTHRKVWWLCKNGHEWEASIAKRSSGRRGCPYCSNKAVLSGYNDLATKYPEVAKEWHPTKNGSLTPSSVTWGSNKKVWWLCPNCGYEWEAIINKRTTSGEKCPCCGPIAKQIKIGFNDLKTTHPELVAEWHPTKNGELTPDNVTFGSNKTVFWICPVCHNEYDARVADRVKGNSCPYCAGKRIKAGFNDLATRYPEVAKEWHPTKNGGLTPSDILPRSMKKYWWKCSRCGNEWEATPDSRINKMSCPECSFYSQTSFPEQAILYYLKKLYPDTEGRNKDLGIELDIFIPSIKVAIEYDGVYYHNEKRQYGVAENEKDALCAEKGISLYRIREKGLNPISSSISIIRKNLTNADLDRCINILLDYLGVSTTVSVDKDQSKILAQYNTFIHDNCLQTVNPKLATEWHPTKNCGLKPEFIPAGSGKKAWWLCPVCHGEWQTRIVERNQGKGCPYCANQKVLVGFNDLATQNQRIATEWHPTKNGTLTPYDVVNTSNKKVWWICKTCGNEWQATISSRIRQNLGCPKCGTKKGIITRRLNKIENGSPTLAQKYPELAAEWHPTKNGDLTPNTVTYHSGLMVWWKYSICGEEWQQPIYNRALHHITGCVKCRKKRKQMP
ncbi:MAG: zinc-ribbon domain-containing protein [Alphaproteobacteria bacterium]|nr:zinc-ribbon domain-containing protein [Alphaproteobacteria bacterium]